MKPRFTHANALQSRDEKTLEAEEEEEEGGITGNNPSEISRPPAKYSYRWVYVNRVQGKWLCMVRAFFCLFSFISVLEPGKVFLKMNFEEYSLFW
jgi:hypothetical protein